MNYWNETEFQIILKNKAGNQPEEIINCYSIENAFNKIMAKFIFDLELFNVPMFNGFKTNIRDKKLILTYFMRDDDGSEVPINLSLESINKYLNSLCNREDFKYCELILKEK